MPSKYRSSFQRGHVYKNPVWVPSSRLSKEGINVGYLAWQRAHMQLRKTVGEDRYIASCRSRNLCTFQLCCKEGFVGKVIWFVL